MKNVDVAILGASGMVGQKFIELLDNHPCLKVRELVASEHSKGKTLNEIGKPINGNIPDYVKDARIKGMNEKLESKIVFSALPAELAKETEWKLAREGKFVISKASANRFEKDVPLLIPEVNSEHLGLLKKQKQSISGGLVCDPNCTTIILSLSLKPLIDRFKTKKIIVNSMQAVSGAGYPGLPSLAIMGNVIPYIANEEEKVRNEPKKIFGRLVNGSLKNSDISVFASCNRVPVTNCHSISVYVEFEETIDVEAAKDCFKCFNGLPNLPSSPKKPIIVREEPDRPQPMHDNDGMAVSVGRVRQGIDKHSLAYFVVGDNLVRGAAGAGILDAELLLSEGYL